MAEKIIWDRIAEMDVEVKGGNLAVMEYRQVGNQGLLSGFDHEKGQHFFAKIDALPKDVGTRAKDIGAYIKANGNAFASGMKDVAHFDDMPMDIFERVGRKLGTAHVETNVAHKAPADHGSTTLHINKETGAVDSLMHKGGRKLGLAFGVVAAGYLTLRGEFAQAAEAVIPGAPSAIALAQGRPAEAVMAGIEDILPPGAGLAVTEMARPIARQMGLDVDKGLLQPGQLQATSFDRFYDSIPGSVRPGMPPEVESLVEAKGLIRQAETRLAEAGNRAGSVDYDLAGARLKAEKTLTAAQERFSGQYDELKASGGMDVVEDYLAGQPSQPDAQPAPAGTDRPAPVRVAAKANMAL